MPRHKRPRGGQPGNQNARKHGFYAKNLSPQESCEYWSLINTHGLTPQAAVLHLKIQSVFQNAPNNYTVLRDISKLLVKQHNAQNPLSRKDNRVFKKVIRDIIKAVATGNQESIERIVAETITAPEILINESYLEQIIDKNNQLTNRS